MSVIERPPEFGGDFRVGAEIPPYRIYTIEHDLPELEQWEHNVAYLRDIGRLFKTGTAGKKSSNSFVDKKTGLHLDIGVLRRLLHGAFFPMLEVISQCLPERVDNVKALRTIIESDDKGLY